MLDAAFPPDATSIGRGAELCMRFLEGNGAPPRSVAVPIIWRRPADIVDEDGGLAAPPPPPCRTCGRTRWRELDLASDLAALASRRAAGVGGMSGGSGGGGGSADAALLPPARDLAYLREQCAQRAHNGDTPQRTRGPEWVLWRAPLSAGDVVQGALGDCWLVNALALVAERDWLVRRLFPDADAAATAPLPRTRGGAHRVRLCLRGAWHVLHIDDSLPCSGWSGAPAFARCRRRQLWASLVEKAAAKAAGSYAALITGSTAEGLRMLTGAPALSISVQTGESCEEAAAAAAAAAARRGGERGGGVPLLPGELPPAAVLDALWVRLSSFAAAGFLMGATAEMPAYYATKEGDDAAAWHAHASRHAAHMAESGIVADHSYALLEVQHVRGAGATPHRLLRLRNPWSVGGDGGGGGGGSRPVRAGGWAGAWSDGSREWDAEPALRERLGPHRQSDEGVFWMALADFALLFTRVDVAQVRGTDPVSGRYDAARDWQVTRLRVPLALAASGSSSGDAGSVAVVRLSLPHALSSQVDVIVSFGGWEEGGEEDELDASEDARGGVALALPPRSPQSLRRRGDGRIPAHTGASCGGLGFAVLQELSPAAAAAHGGVAAAITGLALAPGSPALHSVADAVFAECTLQGSSSDGGGGGGGGGGGDYLLVAHALGAGARSPGGGGGGAPWAVVELHSALPLLVEREARPRSWLARALACVAATHGSRMPWTGGSDGAGDGGKAVILFEGGAGSIVLAANLHPTDAFEVSTSVRPSAALAVLSRAPATLLAGYYDAAVSTRDVIAPLSAQLLQMLTARPLGRAAPAGATTLGSTAASARSLAMPTWWSRGEVGSEHSPRLLNASDLHAPFHIGSFTR